MAREPDVEVTGEFGDGAAVLDALPGGAPDLMFLDVQMPGMTGLDLLRAWPGDIPAPLVVFRPSSGPRHGLAPCPGAR